MLATRMRMAAAGVTGTPAAGWWVVAGKTCVAAYQPIGAASLAASYTNLANPGTYDAAPGTAPTWAAATGWTFNGTDQYLTTGVLPVIQSWSYIVSFANVVNNYGTLGGGYSGVEFGIRPTAGPGASNVVYQSGAAAGLVIAPALTSGVVAFAGNTAYRNGSPEAGSIPTGVGTFANGLYIAARNNSGTAQSLCAVDIYAFAIYSDTLSGAEVATLSAAMAALT